MKKGVLENFAKFTGEHIWFVKFSKTPFLQNTSARLLLPLAFQKEPLEVFLKILQNSQKNTFGLRSFQKHHFYRTPLDDYFWIFRATLLKWVTANNIWKTSDEYSLSRNTNLRSTIQVYHLFFQQVKFSVYVFIGLHCLLPEAAIRVDVFCKTRYSLRFSKFHRKTPVLDSLFNKVAGGTPIMKNICRRLLLHCTRTTHCYLSVGFILYSTSH